MQLKTKTELQTGTNELSQRKNCVLNQHTLSCRQKDKRKKDRSSMQLKTETECSSNEGWTGNS